MSATAHPSSNPSTIGHGSRQLDADCSPGQRITRSLLGYGVIAGPLYLIVAVVQILTRAGFDPSRHSWSLLANGGPGWVQTTNFAVTGAMTIAFAVGLRRALRSGVAATWAPRLIGGYGAALLAAAIFRADPGDGFPVGTPDGPGVISWHGMAHLGAGAVGFSCLTIAFFVLARRYSADGNRRWASAFRAQGAAIGIGFAAVAVGGGSPASIVAFTVAVLLACAGTCAVAVDRYRVRTAGPSDAHRTSS